MSSGCAQSVASLIGIPEQRYHTARAFDLAGKVY
jgi:hypothetical protein